MVKKGLAMKEEELQVALEELIDESPDEWTLERLEQIQEFFLNLNN